MKTVLVTGSNGFIGKHLVKGLIKRNFKVIEFSLPHNDIREEININEKVDLIFHLAALLKETDYSELHKTNVLGTRNVINFALKNHAKLIFASTYVYGNPDKLPVDETVELRPTSNYTKSKIEAENLIINSGLNFIILRQFNIYGPGQDGNMLIPLILKQIKENKEITLMGKPTPKRDFLYVGDLIDGMLLAADYLNNNRAVKSIINMGSGKSYSVEETVRLIQKIKGTNKETRYQRNSSESEVFDSCADISKAKRILNWSPIIGIEEGLKKTSLNY